MEELLAIKVDSVSKEYPGVMALKNVDLRIKKGSIHGFLGPNGAGKSTTMKIISGLIPATSGDVSIMGIDINKNPKEASSLIGFLPENPPLYKNMRVRDYLTFVYEINSKDRKNTKKAVDRVVETCGLIFHDKRMIGHLSKGYQQRVGMAQALVYNPPIVIFDEPTVGLDPRALDEIRNLIISLSVDHTIMLSTHQLHEASLLCHDISIINQGVIVKEGGLKDIQQSLQTKQTISIDLLRWNADLEKRLFKRFSISDLDHSNNNNKGIHLEVSFDSEDDQRSELSQFLIEHGCGLIGFKENQIDLEAIFKRTTSKLSSEVSQ